MNFCCLLALHCLFFCIPSLPENEKQFEGRSGALVGAAAARQLRAERTREALCCAQVVICGQCKLTTDTEQAVNKETATSLEHGKSGSNYLSLFYLITSLNLP